jgi:hypothetical protein
MQHNHITGHAKNSYMQVCTFYIISKSMMLLHLNFCLSNNK